MYVGLPKTRSDFVSGVRNHLLLAKTTPPTLPASQITRKELQARVDRAGGETVVLFQAPAGFGKTTLMLQVMNGLLARGVTTTWLTVDAADNDVGRFLSFLGAAFDKLLSGVAPANEAETDGATGVVALDLMERIACTPAPFVLFVDDAELLQNAASLAVLRQVIENLPEGCRIVIGSRTMLDIGAPRLLARGQLLVIDPIQLRFSIAETGDYLRDKRGLNMPGADIARLQGATEGWPVALWLASLALERSDRSVELVSHFSGSNTLVADYLAEEVLAQQSQTVREFLVRTSVLHHFKAQLCDTVRGQSDSREILESLQRSNLFVQRLSEDGEWFRYHSLFAGFLRTQLERQYPQDIPDLHRAASRWYDSQNRPVPAVEHALASADFDYALPMLERIAEQLLEGGRIRLLARLLDSVPPQELANWPQLRLMHAWALSFTRGGQEAMQMLKRIEAQGPLPPQLEVHALALRPMLLTMLDRFDEAYHAGQGALDRVTAEQAFPFSILRTSLANLHMIMGKYTSARELLDRSRVQQDAPAGPFMTIFAQCVEGAIDLLHGRLRQATARFKHSSAVGSRRFLIDTNGNAMAGILLAEVLYEQDELTEAERLLSVYVPLMQELGMTDHLICGHRGLARIAHHAGDHDRALLAVTEMECFGHRMSLPRLVANAQLERARLALWHNDAKSAREALQRARAAVDWTPVMSRALFGNDMDTLLEGQLRLMIHSGAANEAVNQLKQELERAENAKRHRRALKLRILLALALDKAGNSKASLRMARDALRLGARERFVRIFLDEGEPMQRLLQRLSLAQQNELDETANLADYLKRLAGQRTEKVEAPAPAPGATEALTRKELEILRLLAEGLSNLAIAGRLFVSETTVRTHLRNINAKFGVHNRTQAIAVARKLNLIG